MFTKFLLLSVAEIYSLSSSQPYLAGDACISELFHQTLAWASVGYIGFHLVGAFWSVRYRQGVTAGGDHHRLPMGHHTRGCHILQRNRGWKQLSAPCPNSCFLLDLISVLPQPLPPSRPVSRFLTAQDCALLIFSPLLGTCPSLSPGPLLHPQSPPKAPPQSPGQRLQSYWTNLFLGFCYRSFREETILEIPGPVPCLIKNKGVGKRLEEQPSSGRKPRMPTQPATLPQLVLGSMCSGLDGVCWPFRQVHCEGCHRLASAGGGGAEREGGRWKVHIYHIWDFA